MKLARALPRSLPTWMIVAFAAGCVSGGSPVSQTGGTTSGTAGTAGSNSTATGTGGAAPSPACPDPTVFFDIFVDGVQQIPSAASQPVGNFFGAIPAPPQPPAGLLSLHMTNILVATGNAVTAGDHVGTSSNVSGLCGTANGVHLHYEIRERYTGTSAVGTASCAMCNPATLTHDPFDFNYP